MFEKHQDALNEALDEMLAADPDTVVAVPGTNMQAQMQHGSDGGRLITIPVSDSGDFYQHSYRSGILWTDAPREVIDKNPDATLVMLGGGWYIYGSAAAQ